MEELIFRCIKKGCNNREKLSKKVGKGVNYINVYTTQLKWLGLIDTICPTCDRNGYYVIVGNNK